MKNQLTLDAMLSELTAIINADFYRTGCLFGYLNGALDTIRLDQYPVTGYMRVLFDYAVNARIESDAEIDDIVEQCSDYFLKVVPSSSLLESYAEGPFSGICATIVERAAVRWRLDQSQIPSFTIREIAILAGMDERSVRNAASPKLPKPLKTFNDADGTTRVLRADLLYWLDDRRSFRKTEFVSSNAQRSYPVDGFEDLQALRQFMLSACAVAGLDWLELAPRSGIDPHHPAWQTKGVKPFEFVREQFAGLAASLSLEAKPFLLAAFKGFQRAELAWLESVIQA